MEEAFRYLIAAAQESDVKVIAVASVDSQQIVRDLATERFGTGVTAYGVTALTDSEIDQIVDRFPELSKLKSNARSRKLLGRLVIAGLFVRGRVRGVPLTEADAMQEVWAGLVRRHEKADRGAPVARDVPLLRLADFELYGGDRLEVISDVDPAAVDGLCRDELLRTSPRDAYRVHLSGLDVFDPATMETDHRDGVDVPAWFLDTDYNGLCFHVCQAFFPRTSAWEGLRNSLRGDFKASVWQHLSGTSSAPFAAGTHEQIAVKVIDNRGNELLVVKHLAEADT